MAIIITLSSALQGSAESRFNGGMTGYFQYAAMAKSDGHIRGLAWGLGGILNFQLSPQFRVSTIGSTYRLRYQDPAKKGSFLEMGYGGMGLEYCVPVRSDNIALGFMAGGGRLTNLFIRSRSSNDSISARYESNGIMIVAPAVSYERALSKTVFFLIRTEYLICFHDGELFTTGSPGARAGIVFKK
ncbi:MAG: hypothetical protein JXA71_17135 [Chitinispirillaceae bacterium]|nr:hypothetical protein [Chitinispirillaceae bacterium]